MRQLKISTAIIFIALLGFTSCKKINPERELIGTWTSTNEDDVIVEAGALGGVISAALKESGFSLPQQLVFNSDNTGTFVADKDTKGTFTYSHTKNTITITFSNFLAGDTNMPPIPLTFNYTINKQKKMNLRTDMIGIVKLFLELYEDGKYKNYAGFITKFEVIGWYQK